MERPNGGQSSHPTHRWCPFRERPSSHERTEKPVTTGPYGPSRPARGAARRGRAGADRDPARSPQDGRVPVSVPCGETRNGELRRLLACGLRGWRARTCRWSASCSATGGTARRCGSRPTAASPHRRRRISYTRRCHQSVQLRFAANTHRMSRARCPAQCRRCRPAGRTAR